MTTHLEQHYPETRFGGFTDVDGTIAFYTRVNALLTTQMTVLDVGCGRGEHDEDSVEYRRRLRNLKGKVHKVIGIDVDEAGTRNPTLDEFRRLRLGAAWPVEDESIDLLICDWVIEHVQVPDEFMSECARVLRGGGVACFRTLNAAGYVAVVSRLVPDRYHAKVLGATQDDRQEGDVFPTVYRCNTTRKLRSAMQRHGLEGVAYTQEAEPSYLSFSGAAYRLGVWHQRWAPRFLKLVLVGFGRKV